MTALDGLATPQYAALPGLGDILAKLQAQTQAQQQVQGLDSLVTPPTIGPLPYMGSPSPGVPGQTPPIIGGPQPTYPSAPTSPGSPSVSYPDPGTAKYGARDPFLVAKFSLPDWTGSVTNGAIPAGQLKPVGNTSFLMQPQAATALAKMLAAAHKAGIDLGIGGTYRDLAGQQAAYARYQSGQGALAATPGTSNHGLGLAVDLTTDHGSRAVGFSDPAYAWLLRNGPKYGYTNPWAISEGPGTGEAWHLEFGMQTPTSPPTSTPTRRPIKPTKPSRPTRRSPQQI